ncbi:MAG: hypothetical protein H6735_33840 [Alphaproteobacteria bacterium]|nr:hypothetical protein [Alphaproteobacteria bacterium]
MRIDVDKIASAARHVVTHPRVVLGSTIPAVAGTVVAGRVLDEKSTYKELEDAHGRMRTVHRGDVVVGVLGSRDALRGYSGVVPESVAPGDILHLLNLGGVIGRCTSVNPDVGQPFRVEILGSVLRLTGDDRQGEPASILPGPVPLLDELPPLPPVVLLAGTCMHAGKTAAACALVRRAARRGLVVGACKLTGVALRRDTLEMEDHGASVAHSFADAGLPSTNTGPVVPAARGVLAAVAEHRPDLIVAELGDGLLGTYGVMDVLTDPAIQRSVSAVVLSANDPVGAWGAVQLLEPLGLRPVVVTGPATDNAAGCSVITERSGVATINARQSAEAFGDHVLDSLRGAPSLRVVAGRR